MTILQRRCPKCGGNLYLDYDEYGPIETCLQCGYERNVDTVKPNKEPTNSVEGGKHA
jgi:DNA-directed RNA polymerase subunit M/transcription elongation factor TFIIS